MVPSLSSRSQRLAVRTSGCGVAQFAALLLSWSLVAQCENGLLRISFILRALRRTIRLDRAILDVIAQELSVGLWRSPSPEKQFASSPVRPGRR